MKHVGVYRSLALALAIAVSSVQFANAEQKNEMVWGELLPETLDPHLASHSQMQFYMLNTYDGLYRYEGNPPQVVPWLATAHEVSQDGKTWTFKLRKDVQFHDGTVLDSSDVVYSFRRLLAMGRGPASAFSSYLKPENISAPDNETVRFVLNERYAPFLSALPLVSIVNEGLLSSHQVGNDWGAAWLSSNEAGSGAYALDTKTYRPLEAMDVHRFAEHFHGWSDNPRPIETVRVRPSKETSTSVLVLLKGAIDATDSFLPPDQVKRVEADEGLRVSKDESMRILVIRMNNKKPPFDNVNFRKCLSYAFNYDGYIAAILQGYAVRNPGPIPQNLWGAPKDLEGYTFDMSKAKEFCDRAKAEGAPIDRKLKLFAPSEHVQMAQTGQVLQAETRKLGLDIEIIPATFPSLAGSMGTPESTPDMWVHWVSTYFADPENWIGQMYDSRYHGTWKASSWYENAQVDEILGKARSALSQEDRRSLYEEASRIIVKDAADIWVYNTIQLRGINKRVNNFHFTPVGAGGELRWMSLGQ
ncbi:ABC transporter substrate-binding protein [Aminobacter ciceronei]|uniref:Peptide/nickel transport system substrate-binding protein n=1 Tax=Aminobacter ciceronei TaxID=150723 RepID=A0ABR6CF90_9HYPH|nr:ABC transporter substrate-binding protein [Aminobacter ciceronei]MBA8909944.1 peptide/nickel transport system substrate-binding protein [Aminobacter ciceronei]MBA9023716.1 peptide/nickel transport system substrate-binding protein [Aminobacter ciceronei]